MGMSCSRHAVVQLRVSRGSEELKPGIKPHCVTFLDCWKPQDCESNVDIIIVCFSTG